MKRLLFFISLLVPALLAAQGFSLTIHSQGIHTDSIRFQVFDGKSEFRTALSAAYRKTVKLTRKENFEPGYYQVASDSGILFNLLISNVNNQKIEVDIDAVGAVVFRNSEENNRAIAYSKTSAEFERQAAAITQSFEQARNTLPAYMLEELAQKLLVQADSLTAAEAAYKRSVVEQNAGTLLASIVQFSIATPEPPREYYQSRALLRQYKAAHAFDTYPFADARMAHTPMAVLKLRQTAYSLSFLDTLTAQQILEDLLNRAQADSVTYETFFTKMEQFFAVGSDFWNEDLSQTLYRNALNYNRFNKKYRNYFEQLFSLTSRNCEGMRAADFEMLLSDGQRKRLYDINADYLMLWFQNPDCWACAQAREELAQNEDLRKAVASGKLRVLTVYTEDKEDVWRQFLAAKADSAYLHGWDDKGVIMRDTLYDLRNMPHIFILDGNKTVLKKYLYFTEVSAYLKQLGLE